jgi:hypothetical protein
MSVATSLPARGRHMGLVIGIVGTAIIVGVLYSILSKPLYQLPFHQSLFKGAVIVEGGNYRPYHFSVSGRPLVGLVFVRQSDYEIFPAEKYQMTISIPHSLTPPIIESISTGDKTQRRYESILEWQWADGTTAQLNDWKPEEIRVELVRISDGKRDFAVVPTGLYH